ncbi:hypothetical protein F5Y19DRAFT_446582 [Xylariaceae sp. FL1651]|nr:hypothetical protein F5Y19DRAFT_446582 [Xylariaceae sp. FL1651]
MPNEMEEQAIFDRQLHGLTLHLPRARLLDFASGADKLLLDISCVCASLRGALNPLLTVSQFFTHRCLGMIASNLGKIGVSFSFSGKVL